MMEIEKVWSLFGFGIGFHFDYTWAIHFVIYAGLVWPFWKAFERFHYLFRRGETSKDRRRKQTKTFGFDPWSLMRIRIAGLNTAFLSLLVANQFVEIMQGFQYQWNPNNFYGLDDTPIGLVSAFIIYWILDY